MGLDLVVPAPQLCTDNGVMVAWAGVERLALGLWEHLPASSQDDAWVDVRPRWPLTDQCVLPSLSTFPLWLFCDFSSSTCLDETNLEALPL